MSDPTPVRAGKDAGREEARERAAAWLRAYRLDIHEWADAPYPKLETLTREFESFGRHAKAAAEARAAAVEAEVARLRGENDRLRIAFHDATRRPLGVTPDSGAEFYDQRMADEAEERRATAGRTA